MRLAGVSSIAAANAWLPGFITAYNSRFGRDPANAKDLHRPLTQADDLDEILAWREERTVTRNLTLHYDRMMLLLDPTSLARGLVRKKVEVVNYPDGRFAVQFNGAPLGFRVFDKIQTVQPGAIVDNKRLSAVLEQVKAQQAAYPARQQRGHLARQRPPNNLEAPGLPSKGRAPRHRAAAAGLRQRSGSRADCHRAFSCIPFSGDATRHAGHLRAVARWGFLGIGRSTPMARRSGGSATADWREPASSDRLPIHRSESPTGYSSAGCSPAEPACASPVTDNNSPIPIQRANQITLLNFTARMQAHSRSSCPRQRGVSSLLCTPGDISILRRQIF